MKPVKKKSVLFAYVSPENRHFVNGIAAKHNEKMSVVVDKIIESYRTGKKVVFETVVPRYVKQADEWKKKHG